VLATLGLSFVFVIILVPLERVAEQEANSVSTIYMCAEKGADWENPLNSRPRTSAREQLRRRGSF
jgi:hypothetical protein